ncbi:MAG: hypothetical protein JSS34_06640 [Proteobacteria bacterium]|nr:hypothetical protein [Pseudomonadota bacterium]
MTILTHFFILAFSFLFLMPYDIVNAFGDDAWYTYKEARPHSPRTPEPEPVETNLHRKISVTPGMPGIIIKFGFFKDNEFVRKNTLLFTVEAMKMELAIWAPFSGYITLTPKYKKFFTEMSSKNFSYKNFFPLVDSDDIFFILSEDNETDNQDSSFYNTVNDDDDINKSSSSPKSVCLSDSTKNISLLDLLSERAFAHYLSDSLSKHTLNLEEFIQISFSQIALQSSLLGKITLKILELGYNVLTFNVLRNQNYKGPFSQNALPLSSKEPLSSRLNHALNFSKTRNRMNIQKEQAETLPYFNLQSSLSQPNVKHLHQSTALFFKKEVLLWNLIALYSLLSICFFFQSRPSSFSFLLNFLFEEKEFHRQNLFKKVKFFLPK